MDDFYREAPTAEIPVETVEEVTRSWTAAQKRTEGHTLRAGELFVACDDLLLIQEADERRDGMAILEDEQIRKMCRDEKNG